MMQDFLIQQHVLERPEAPVSPGALGAPSLGRSLPARCRRDAETGLVLPLSETPAVRQGQRHARSGLVHGGVGQRHGAQVQMPRRDWRMHGAGEHGHERRGQMPEPSGHRAMRPVHLAMSSVQLPPASGHVPPARVHRAIPRVQTVFGPKMAVSGRFCPFFGVFGQFRAGNRRDDLSPLFLRP
jgi:hypothetical protein